MNPRQLQTSGPQMRNVPMRPRAWHALLETPGTVVAERERGSLALIPEAGELHLYWSFGNMEDVRTFFPEMFAEIRPHLTPDNADYVVMDLVEVHGKEWLAPVLADADFEFFAEWMELTHPDLDPNVVPEFPDEVKMRLAKKGDLARVREIWAEAYGEYADGARAIAHAVDAASWIGILERDGEIAAFAANGDVENAEGRVLTAAVAPDWWGHGYGQLALSAAAYQLATRDARRATVIARPDVPHALRTCSSTGFRPGRMGLEYRRTTDEDAIRERREARRRAGVKARFGDWR